VTEIGFYHLTRFSLEQALPKLLEKAYGAGHRILVRTGDAARLARLDQLLWTYDADSFLPHGTDPKWGALQPIHLSAGTERPNEADVLVLVDGRAPEADIADFTRCLILFDGTDEAAVTQARSWWTRLKADDHPLTYWKQKDSGGWEKGAG